MSWFSWGFFRSLSPFLAFFLLIYIYFLNLTTPFPLWVTVSPAIHTGFCLGGKNVAGEDFDFRLTRIFPVMEKIWYCIQTRENIWQSPAPPISGPQAPRQPPWHDPLVRDQGVETRFFSMGRSIFLGFNEIIYCLFALTKIVNVTGEI